MDADGKLEDQYKAMLEHCRHLENRSFTTLGNFLTASAFIFAAWATIYARASEQQSFAAVDVFLSVVALVGYVFGITWALLGARNWGVVRRVLAHMTIV